MRAFTLATSVTAQFADHFSPLELNEVPQENIIGEGNLAETVQRKEETSGAEEINEEDLANSTLQDGVQFFIDSYEHYVFCIIKDFFVQFYRMELERQHSIKRISTVSVAFRMAREYGYVAPQKSSLFTIVRRHSSEQMDNPMIQVELESIVDLSYIFVEKMK